MLCKCRTELLKASDCAGNSWLAGAFYSAPAAVLYLFDALSLFAAAAVDFIHQRLRAASTESDLVDHSDDPDDLGPRAFGV